MSRFVVSCALVGIVAVGLPAGAYAQGGVRADGPLDAGAVNVLKALLELVGKGETLSDAQQVEFDRLVVRLRTSGVQTDGDKDLEKLAGLIERLGSLSDNVAGKLTGKAATVMTLATYQLNYIQFLVEAIDAGVKRIKEAEFSHYEDDIREAVSFADLKRRLANKDGQFDKLTWEGWSDEHRVRAITEYLERRSRSLRESLAPPPQKAGRFSLQIVDVRNQSEYTFRFLSKFLFDHSATYLRAKTKETLYVVTAKVANLTSERQSLILEPKDAALIDSAEKPWPLLPTVYGRLGRELTFRGMGGFDAPSPTSPYRVVLEPKASERVAFVFAVPAGTMVSRFRYGVLARRQPETEKVTLTFEVAGSIAARPE